MLVFPNAKINLGLNITEKRKDGFHNLETIFLPIGLKDVLEVSENKEKGFQNSIEFSFSGFQIPGNADDNLIAKAYRLIRNDYPIPALHVHLHKAIPFGAGLGGGSSDVVFFMNQVDEMFSLNLSWGEKHNYAKQLGSDCSFFIVNKPCFATGKGDDLEKLDFNLNGFYFVLIKPNIGVSTAEAYSRVKAKLPEVSIKEIIKMPMENWKTYLKNDFEESVFAVYPEVETIKNEMYNAGAVYAAMSGSGSSVFGLFRNEKPRVKTQGEYFIWEEKF